MSSQGSFLREPVSYVYGTTREIRGRNARKICTGWDYSRAEWRRRDGCNSKRRTLRDYRSNLKYNCVPIELTAQDFIDMAMESIKLSDIVHSDNLSINYQMLSNFVHTHREIWSRSNLYEPDKYNEFDYIDNEYDNYPDPDYYDWVNEPYYMYEINEKLYHDTQLEQEATRKFAARNRAEMEW